MSITIGTQTVESSFDHCNQGRVDSSKELKVNSGSNSTQPVRKSVPASPEAIQVRMDSPAV